MKNQFFGIFFYLLYLVAMLRPIMPYLDYMVNYNYIAEALCENRDKPYLECNGKCYLEKRLSETSHDSHEHHTPVPKINLEDYPVSLIEGSESKSEEDFQVHETPSFQRDFELQEYIFIQDKPPAILI